MYDFQYDYIKPKYGEKAKLCYIDTDSFIAHVKIEDIYKDIAGDIGKKKDLILQITTQIERYPWGKKSNWVNER